VKEQTAEHSAPIELERPTAAVLQRGLIPALFVALALLVTSGYGSGLQLNDGQAALHIDPEQFLRRLLHAWNPQVGLGTHTGFWVAYQTPYSWLYAAAQVLHVSQTFAQHAAVFAVYLGCLWSMYYCLRSVAPWLDEIACIAGSCAFLFNMYVALNSQAQIVWLLTYGTVPAMVGVMARALRAEMNLWRAALAVALLVLIGGGINPPLVAINAAIVALFLIVTVGLDAKPARAAARALPIVCVTAICALAINLYWIVPFLDYFRGGWLGGVLTEAPSMHNAATSFANVLRGLGHWATFASFGDRPYFPWAVAYASGLFGALLWVVPIVALGGIAFRRNQRPVTLFFLLVTIVSVPLVVGYYHDQLGSAVTTPLYDQLYRNVPGFQMFRFSYKWVAGVEFGLSGLYALGVYAMIAALGQQIEKLDDAGKRKWNRIVPAARTLAILVPILTFIPVLIDKMNYPGEQLPAWEYRENTLVGADQQQRVALFPTQFLEQFDWGNPQFYIEDALVGRPMVYGLLGSEPSQGADLWVRRAYRATREGLPFSADMLRVLGVDTILQRDDFIPAIDFSSPGEWRFNDTTLTHDLLQRVIGATPVRADGPLRIYRVGGALPLLYGVTHPVISTSPAFSDAYLGNVEAMAKGQAQFDPPDRSMDEFAATMRSLSPVLPASADEIRDLAVNQALARGIRVHPPPADAGLLTAFDVRSTGTYAVFARDESLLFYRPAPQTLEIDGQFISVKTGGAWTQYGQVALAQGSHWLSDGYVDPDLVVALVNLDDLKSWERTIASVDRALPRNLVSSQLVYDSHARVKVAQSGYYRVTASAIGSFGPDGLAPTRVLAGTSSQPRFSAALSPTLPYVFGDGVVGTSALMMPQQWYREDATAYAWQRGDPMSWFLFAREAHAHVYVGGANPERVAISMRISRLQVADFMTVTVQGQTPQNVALPGPPADPQQYDTVDGLQGPMPVAVSFSVTLQPGWNDVAFTFQPLAGERSDLGSDVISAAVAPDVSFQAIGPAHGAPRVPAQDRSVTTVALAKPTTGLFGDPEVIGNVSATDNRVAWLAVALTDGKSTTYRLLPIDRDGSFDITFMHAFANDWNDTPLRLAGIWFLAQGSRPKFTDLYYNVHAMPARALPGKSALSAPPMTVDGSRVGASPIFLARGTHRIASANRGVKIGLLSLAPANLPQTKDLRMIWDRRSPTDLEVTVKSAGSPFLLVFGEAYHPEWRATLDGRVLSHVVVDGFANGWIVPNLPGGGQIVLTFVGQQYYVVAAAISAIALLLLIVVAWAPELLPIGKAKS